MVWSENIPHSGPKETGIQKELEEHVIDLLEYGDQYIEPEVLVELGTRIYKEGASIKWEVRTPIFDFGGIIYLR